MKNISALAILIAGASAAAGAQATCPFGNDDIRVQALATITQLESDQVMPVLQKVLDRKDECSVTLRRQAVQFLARSREPERVDMLLRVARTDANSDVRRTALQVMAQINTPRVAAALDSVLFSTSDAEMQESVLRALASQSSPSARDALHRVIESSQPIDLRVHAANYLANSRRGEDDTEYLRAQYAKATSPDLRDALLRAIAYQRSPSAMSFLLGIARDKNQELELRRRALSAVGQYGLTRDGQSGASAMEVKGLLALYEEFSGQVEMQSQLLDTFGNRGETIVTDKLLQIAKDEKNMELRRRAVSRLGQRRDPRVREFLIGLVNQ
ncbi:MAG: HEAT repeat domain-containing protein [Gemmatimonadaceae bacterium]